MADWRQTAKSIFKMWWKGMFSVFVKSADQNFWHVEIYLIVPVRSNLLLLPPPVHCTAFDDDDHRKFSERFSEIGTKTGLNRSVCPPLGKWVLTVKYRWYFMYCYSLLGENNAAASVFLHSVYFCAKNSDSINGFLLPFVRFIIAPLHEGRLFFQPMSVAVWNYY